MSAASKACQQLVKHVCQQLVARRHHQVPLPPNTSTHWQSVGYTISDSLPLLFRYWCVAAALLLLYCRITAPLGMAGRRRRGQREPLHSTAAIAPALLLLYCCFTAVLPTSTAPLGMAGRRRRGQVGAACPAPQHLRKGHGSGRRAPRRRPVRACRGVSTVRLPSVVAYWPPPPSLCPPQLPPRHRGEQGGGGER